MAETNRANAYSIEISQQIAGVSESDESFQPQDLPCCCHEFQNRLPEGHVATGLVNLCSVYPEFPRTAQASAASTLFPGKHNWIDRSNQHFNGGRVATKMPLTHAVVFDL